MKNTSPVSSSLNRRDFLKAGCAAGMLGLGSLAAVSLTGCSGANFAASFGTALGTFDENPDALTAHRWGMVIDVQKLTETIDFETIVEACHSNHNVPSIDNPKTEVKWIWEDSFEHCFEELENEYLPTKLKEMSIPVLCNHCEDPACVRVCPTEATFKREDGIVAMDYHRCIGCRFCMTGCPYNARSLNFSDPRDYLDEINPNFPTREQGVVEKCNFCVERLEQGRVPYCAEASEGTILFGDLEDPASEVRQALEKGISLRRLTELGTGPSVYYLVGEGGSRA